MSTKMRFLVRACGVALLSLSFSNLASAQCTGGGGGAGRQTGSMGSLAIAPTSFGYPSNGIAMSGYPSAGTMAFNQYQQQALQIRNQAFAMANQMAADQAQKRAAYEQMVRPMRLARAEATRAKRAERIAKLKANSEAYPSTSDSQRYALASVSH